MAHKISGICAMMALFLILVYIYVNGLMDRGIRTRHTDMKSQALSFQRKELRFFYNRVAKCGSRTMYQSLKSLPSLRTFLLETKLHPFTKPELVKNISTCEPPCIYVLHFLFIKFEEFGFHDPIYINLLRDPLSRMISYYNHAQRSNDIPYLDFDVCVQENHTVCGHFCDQTGDHILDGVVSYFAGYTPDNYCGLTRLKLAKANIEKYFAVVGYLENYTQFLLTLEWIFPTVFQGVTDIYHKKEKHLKHIYMQKGLYKHIPSKRSKDILKRRLRYEYDLYYYVRARFDNLYRQLQKTGPEK